MEIKIITTILVLIYCLSYIIKYAIGLFGDEQNGSENSNFDEVAKSFTDFAQKANDLSIPKEKKKTVATFNCRNCGAPVRLNYCEYCGTPYPQDMQFKMKVGGKNE